MAANELNCPKCGGVVTINEEDDLTTHCPYCDSLIEIPDRFRRPKQMIVTDLLVEMQGSDQTQKQRDRRALTIGLIAAGGILAVIIFAVVISANRSKVDSSGAEVMVSAIPVIEEPTLTSTPNFAYSIKTFGGSGNGEGLFNNPKYIDADGLGNIYVADYDNGRIQRFTTDEGYQDGWSVSESGELIYGMAVNYDGMVFVAVGRNLKKYDGSSGQFISSIEAYGGGEFGDLTTTIDGDLLAVWYEGRNGVYNSDDPGHREDLVMFDRDLNVMNTKPAFISSITNDAQINILLTVDGNGTIYANSNSTIFVFDKNGTFVDRFTPSEDAPGSFRWVDDIAVDGQGRIYVLESYTIHVFDSNFAFIDDIPLSNSVTAMAIDAQNNIWALSSDQVQELQLRP